MLQAPIMYLIFMLVYRHLLTNRLHGKGAVLLQIMFEKQGNLFIQGYNLTTLKEFVKIQF